MTRRGDDGQAAVPVILFLGMLALAAVVVVVVPVGAATNERSRAQTAADAAALAGAKQVRNHWINTITAPGVLTFPAGPLPSPLPGSLPGSVNGSVNASTYAQLNGSHLTSYEFSSAGGRVRAQVQSLDAAYPENGRAEATATAEMDIDFSSCEWDDPDPPIAELTFVRTLECGAWSATYRIENLGLVHRTVSYEGDTRAGLLADLEPRLVK